MSPGSSGAVKLLSGGTVVKVNAAVLNLGSNATVAIMVSGIAPGSGYDQLSVAGDVNLNGANLLLSGTAALAAGQTFTIVNNAGSDPVIGTFKGLPEGAIIGHFLGSHFGALITYAGGDGNDVVLKVIVLPTTHFRITAPSMAPLGTPVSFTVTALDQFNNPTGSGYTGTVHFSSTDGSVAFPLNNATLTNGTGTFSAIFNTVGTQTLSATDTATSSIAATTSPIAVSMPVLSEFLVNAIASSAVTAGSAFILTVRAADQFGNPRSDFTGPVTFTTTDPQVATLTGITMTNGFGVTLGALKTVAGGPWTISAIAGTLKGTSGPITVTPASADCFTVTAPVPATAITGTPLNLTVTAYDQFQNVATTYTGKVHLTSSDPKAILPADATLSGGIGTVAVTLNSAGSQTVTASDAVSSSPITILGTSAPYQPRAWQSPLSPKPQPASQPRSTSRSIPPISRSMAMATHNRMFFWSAKKPTTDNHIRARSSSTPRKNWAPSTSRPIS